MNEAQVSAWLDQEDERVAQAIRRYGCFIQYVLDDPDELRTSIAYTVGLFGVGHPELVVTGLAQHNASAVLNDVAGRVRRGDNLVPGQLLSFEGWPHRVTIEHLPNPADILFAANRHARRPDYASVPAYALTYDDRFGKFPWEDGYSVPDWIQPRPGTFAA